MVLAMTTFALEDMAIKAAASDIPVGEAVLLYGLAGTMLFALIAKARGSQVLHPAILSPVMVLRSGFEICGRLFFALALAFTPLSSASAILQATPLIVALGAILFFGEKVGIRRWLAIILGFLGVLLILRPGLESFEINSVFAVLATIGFAGRDLATRAAPVSMSPEQIGVLGFSVLTVSGAVLLAISGGATWPTLFTWGALGMAMVSGAFAYNALTIAMRTGHLSIVAPFRYSRLLVALVLGVLVFQERPDMLSLIGSAVVVGSGIWILRLRNSD